MGKFNECAQDINLADIYKNFIIRKEKKYLIFFHSFYIFHKNGIKNIHGLLTNILRAPC